MLSPPTSARAMAVVAALLGGGLVTACSGSPPSSIECNAMGVFPVADGGGCVEPERFDAGVEGCFDRDQAQGHGVKQLCLFDPQDQLFLGVGTSTSWIEAPGWTHSSWAATGTLTSEQLARCESLDADLILSAKYCSDD